MIHEVRTPGWFFVSHKKMIGGLQLEPNDLRKFSASKGQVQVHAGAEASSDMVVAPGAHRGCVGASLARLEEVFKDGANAWVRAGGQLLILLLWRGSS